MIQQSLTPDLLPTATAGLRRRPRGSTAGVSAYPQEVTWQMVENFLAGGAAINVFARHNGLQLQVVDAGVAHDFGARSGLIDAKIASGTRNYLVQPAMSHAQRDQALARGAAIVDGLADQGCRVIAFGEMGIGNTASAALLTHQLTGTPLSDCVGRGTGLDDAGLARKRELLAQAASRAHLPPDADALDVLAEFGGFEIAMMSGAMLAAAARRMVLLIDGFIVTAALLVAARHRTGRSRLLRLLPPLRRSRPSGATAHPRRRAAARPRPAPRRRDRRRAGLAAGPRGCRFCQRDGKLRQRRGQRAALRTRS
jgi:nicotinate-nucleotide--dimethylbenzimidazole phosphoribosyltransferase